MVANLLVGDAGDVGREAANHTLPDVRMQVRLEFGPVTFLAADDEPLPDTFLPIGAQPLGNRLEVVQRFFRHAALGVPAFVAVVAIACAVAGKHVDDALMLAQVVEPQIKESSALAIDHRDTECGLRSQQSGQRLQLKL